MCASETYACAHASVAERFHIVLLFNSDRVIDLARRLYAVHGYTHTYITHIHTYSRPRLLRRKVFAPDGSDGEEKYRLMTLIWEVGASLFARVIFIIHAMSRRP